MDDDAFNATWGAPSSSSAPLSTSPNSDLGASSAFKPAGVKKQKSFGSELDVWGSVSGETSQPATEAAGEGGPLGQDDDLDGDIGSSLDAPPSAAPALAPPLQGVFDDIPDANEEVVPSSQLASVSLAEDPGGPSASTAVTTPDDDDDDFGDMGQAGEGADDDDFGDFGEFDEGTFEPSQEASAFEDASSTPFATPGIGSGSGTGFGLDWGSEGLPEAKPLDLSRTEVAHVLPQTTAIINTIFPRASSSLTNEPDRQVEGLGQILVSAESRSLFTQLTTPPPSVPVDWKRSRSRREHLIALGIPIDLDEVAPTSAKPLAALVLPPLSTSGLSPSTSSPASAPVRSSAGTSFEAITSAPSSHLAGLGTAPRVDRAKADALLALSRENLTLQPLAKLREAKAELESLTTVASNALTHALQVRESLAQDSETYNKVIQDLVRTASQMKGGAAKRVVTPTTGRPASLGPGGWKRSGSPAPGQSASALGNGPSPNLGVAVPVRSMSGDRRYSVR